MKDKTKEVKLISITEYAEKYNINRHTVYRQIREGLLTVYHCKHNEEPHLDPEQSPKDVRRYEDRPEYNTG